MECDLSRYLYLDSKSRNVYGNTFPPNWNATESCNWKWVAQDLSSVIYLYFQMLTSIVAKTAAKKRTSHIHCFCNHLVSVALTCALLLQLHSWRTSSRMIHIQRWQMLPDSLSFSMFTVWALRVLRIFNFSWFVAIRRHDVNTQRMSVSTKLLICFFLCREISLRTNNYNWGMFALHSTWQIGIFHTKIPRESRSPIFLEIATVITVKFSEFLRSRISIT